MHEVYCAESGTHGELSNAVSVAGFISSREKWEAFGNEWKGFLKDVNVRCFHRTELESFQNEFARDKGWDEARRYRVVEEAQNIITKHVERGFAHSVIKQDYDELVTGDVRDKLGRHHYTFCAQGCMRDVTTWAEAGGYKEAINYVFEQGAPGISQLNLMMERTRKREAAKVVFRLGNFSFANKCDEVIDGVEFPGVVQLQAAEFLAYEAYKLIENWYVDGIKKRMRDAMVQLMQIPLDMKYHERDELAALVARVESGDLPSVYS